MKSYGLFFLMLSIVSSQVRPENVDSDINKAVQLAAEKLSGTFARKQKSFQFDLPNNTLALIYKKDGIKVPLNLFDGIVSGLETIVGLDNNHKVENEFGKCITANMKFQYLYFTFDYKAPEYFLPQNGSFSFTVSDVPIVGFVPLSWTMLMAAGTVEFQDLKIAYGENGLATFYLNGEENDKFDVDAAIMRDIEEDASRLGSQMILDNKWIVLDEFMRKLSGNQNLLSFVQN